MTEISAALATGRVVITHSDSVSVPGWTGAGYIIFDPLTGDGAYKISGGENGGVLGLLIAAIFLLLAIAFSGPLLISAGAALWGAIIANMKAVVIVLSIVGGLKAAYDIVTVLSNCGPLGVTLALIIALTMSVLLSMLQSALLLAPIAAVILGLISAFVIPSVADSRECSV